MKLYKKLLPEIISGILIITGCATLKNTEVLLPDKLIGTGAYTNHHSIKPVINKQVVKFIDYYAYRGRKGFKRILKKGHKYFPMIKKVLKENGLPEELAYLPIIESSFNLGALSHKGASGLWQFIEGTGRLYGLRSNWWIDERRDVEKSTLAAAKHLKCLYNSFGDWYLALAAYNAGGKIWRAIRKYKTRDFWLLCKKGKRYLRKETRDYVPKFIAVMIICENLNKFGFEEIEAEPPVLYDVVEIPDATDLKIIAECAGTTVDEIKKLNPELKQWATPPKFYNYKLRIPYGTKAIFLANFSKIPPDQRITYRRHKIKKGESIWTIAKKYRVPRKMILDMNKIKNPKRIRAGDYLIIPIRGLENAKKIDELLSKENKNETEL